MSELDALRPTLDAIASAQVVEPNLPMAVVLQEANDLHHQLQRAGTWLRMLAVGANPAALEDLRVAVAATRRAQSQWVAVRDHSKAQTQHERERAFTHLASLVRELREAGRYAFRKDPQRAAAFGSEHQRKIHARARRRAAQRTAAAATADADATTLATTPRLDA